MYDRAKTRHRATQARCSSTALSLPSFSQILYTGTVQICPVNFPCKTGRPSRSDQVLLFKTPPIGERNPTCLDESRDHVCSPQNADLAQTPDAADPEYCKLIGTWNKRHLVLVQSITYLLCYPLTDRPSPIGHHQMYRGHPGLA